MYNRRRNNSNALWVARIIAAILTGLWGMLLNFWWMPPATLACASTWLFLLVIGISGTLIFLAAEAIGNSIAYEESYKCSMVIAIITGVILVAFFFASMPSWPLFNTEPFKEAITVEAMPAEKPAEVAKALPKVETSRDIPIVDMLTARLIGDRTMGVLGEYSSQYEADPEYNLIWYRGQCYRISPLRYGGYFKWSASHKNGLPGYIMVNVYTQQAQFVKFDEPMVYSPSAAFGENLNRQLRKLFPSYQFDKPQFEIDEEGTPFWVVPVLTPNAGLFGARTIEKVILLNAITGEGTEYLLKDVPGWVDHVFGVSYLMERMDWHLKWVKGVVNLSNSQVRKTSYSFDKEQYTFLPMDGNIYLYNGITSNGKDESNFGFILINIRTGETRYYNNPGAEESSAQNIAQGTISEKNYKAGPVMMVNVDDTPTYFMTLKDSNGLIQRVAFVDKANYAASVAVGPTVEEALSIYRNRLLVGETQNGSGKITFLSTGVKEGTTYFYFKVEGDDRLYVASILLNEKQILLEVGDMVSFTYNQFMDVCQIRLLKILTAK